MPPKPSIEQRDGDVILRLRVQPRASRTELQVDSSGEIRVLLTSVPIRGAANSALQKYLAKRLGIAKSSILLVAGIKSRKKTLKINNTSVREIREKLAEPE